MAQRNDKSDDAAERNPESNPESDAKQDDIIARSKLFLRLSELLEKWAKVSGMTSDKKDKYADFMKSDFDAPHIQDLQELESVWTDTILFVTCSFIARSKLFLRLSQLLEKSAEESGMTSDRKAAFVAAMKLNIDSVLTRDLQACEKEWTDKIQSATGGPQQ
jgi:hypothetical protein